MTLAELAVVLVPSAFGIYMYRSLLNERRKLRAARAARHAQSAE